MNSSAGSAEIVQTISTLYELSLAVGQSLDLRRNAGAFIRSLMTRKRLSDVSLWIRNRYLPPHLVAGGSEDDLSLVYANPENSVRSHSISAGCPIFDAATKRPVSLLPDDDLASGFLADHLTRSGVVCVFAVGELGYLVGLGIARKDPVPAPELGQLKNIMGKFAVSLEGCLAHETTVREAAETIREQQQALMELSTPVVQVWDGILLMPLVGVLDTERGAQLSERLLAAIVEREAAVAILDVTGVPQMDENVARHLLGAVAAARILGAEVILTGLGPAAAQALALLQVDFGTVKTRGSLRAGVREAIALLGIRAVSTRE